MELLLGFLELSEIAVGAASAFVAWFLSRRQYRATAQIDELSGTEKAITIWRELAQDLTKELEKTKDEFERTIDELKTQIDELQRENAELRRIVKQLQKK